MDATGPVRLTLGDQQKSKALYGFQTDPKGTAVRSTLIDDRTGSLFSTITANYTTPLWLYILTSLESIKSQIKTGHLCVDKVAVLNRPSRPAAQGFSTLAATDTTNQSARGGGDAERLACTHLQTGGLRLLERNYRCLRGEIDLVMREGDTLVFVEVRFRASQRFGTSGGDRRHPQATPTRGGRGSLSAVPSDQTGLPLRRHRGQRQQAYRLDPECIQWAMICESVFFDRSDC